MPDFSYQYLNYRGLDDLGHALQAIAFRLPANVELVVGVPRSGILAASLLALQLNLPLSDVAGYLEDRTLMTGRRPLRRSSPEGSRVVVVDDSVLSGTQLREVKAALDAAGRGAGALYASPFVTRESRELVDLYGEVVDPPRIFAWNLLHHRELLARACIDIDGVLCLDPTTAQNDDGAGYRGFLASAQPLFLPSVPVRFVVTSRLERHRQETERWLDEHGVQYSELVMLDHVDAETRRRERLHARHKADFYARSGADLFIESDYEQAIEIAARSGRQVFAIDRREMLYPTPTRALAAAPGPFARSVTSSPPATVLARRARHAAVKLGGARVERAWRRLRPPTKAEAELTFWRERAATEGPLRGAHYERFFTTHFGLDHDFYAGKRLLDVGCGPRGSLEWAGMAAERVGLDPLAEAYRGLGIEAHTMRYVAAPAERMPFADGHFDVVSALNALDHVDHVDDAVCELTRVTKPGGTLLLIVEVGHPPTPTEPQALGWDVLDRFGGWEVGWHKRNAMLGSIYGSLDADRPAEGGAGLLSARLTRR